MPVPKGPEHWSYGKSPFRSPTLEERCEKTLRNGERCGNYRFQKGKYCRFHIPPMMLKKHHAKGRARRNALSNMPRFYSKFMTGALKDFVEECLDAKPHEQLALWEELAMCKHTCGMAVAAYDKALALPEETEKQRQIKDIMVAETGSMMKDSIRMVSEISTRQAAIDASTKDKVSIHNIEYVVRQIVKMIYSVFGMDERVYALEAMIREQVMIRADTNKGTLITPDQDVLDMNSMVPKVTGPLQET